jgi:HEPN domain-containing protein
MSERDSDHWLWRLGAAEWLAAANTELERGREQLGSRRTAITHARRAAGMALNATLVSMAARGWSRQRCESAWGRSYIDHLRTLAAALEPDRAAERAPFELEQCRRCKELLAISVMPPTGLVELARTKDEAARQSLELAAEVVRGCAAIIGS